MGPTYLSTFLFSSFTWCGIGTVLSCSYFYYHISFLSPNIYFYVTYLYIPRHRLHTIFSVSLSLSFPPHAQPFILSVCLSIIHCQHLSLSPSRPLTIFHPLFSFLTIFQSLFFFSFPFACTRTEVFVPSPSRSLMCYSLYLSLSSLSSESPPFIVCHFQFLLSAHFPFRFHVFFIIHSTFSAASSVCSVCGVNVGH